MFSRESWSALRRAGLRVQGVLQRGAGGRMLTVRLNSSVSAMNAKEDVLGTVDRWEDNCSGKDELRLRGERGEWWYTGLVPTAKAQSLPQLCLQNCSAQELKDYFQNSWMLTELLYGGLQGEEPFYRPPHHNLRHPLIFYYGHAATFYTNKLLVAGLIPKGINPYFEDIFEVGVDEMRWDDISTVQKAWPTVDEVHAYRKQVHDMVCNVIDENLLQPTRITMDTRLWSVPMAIEHEKIHLETSSVLIRELPLQLLRKPKFWPDEHPSKAGSRPDSEPSVGVDFPPNELVGVSGDTVRLGKPLEHPSYGWDNEYGARVVDVPNFEASKFMVSNGEFYEFVQSGGYTNEDYWTKDGWGWRTFRNAKWPFFWEQSGPAGSHKYKLRTIFELFDMPWSWPVNVNYHEASAFTNWKTQNSNENAAAFRLLTEAEHHLLRDEEHRMPLNSWDKDPALVYGGEDIAEKGGISANLAYASESPVDALPATQAGFHDVMGNAWEWAEDDFNSLDGFDIHPYYDDFSTPCFDGEHNMILGGSFISCGDAGANLHARYHFRPHFLQHSGFRYVLPSRVESNIKGENIATHLGPKADLHESNVENNSYETAALIQQYLALHYGQDEDTVRFTVRDHANRPDHALNFTKRTAELVQRAVQLGNAKPQRVLDLGCAVGGTSFHLAKTFDNVVGVDYSVAFISHAEAIRKTKAKTIDFQIPIQGNISRGISAKVPSLTQRKRTRFMVGDACNLPSASVLGGKFDAIVMANLLCRLPSPEKCLQDVTALLQDGGVVVLVSPFSWMKEFTPEHEWLQTNDKFSSDLIEEKMHAMGYTTLISEDMPLLIREHERKYQYIISHAAAFKKESV